MSFSIFAPSWTELLNVNIPNDGGFWVGGLGLVPHQSAIHKALYGVWVFHLYYVHSEEDAHYCDFVFVPINITLTAVTFILFFPPTDSNAAKRMCGLFISTRGETQAAALRESWSPSITTR